MPTEILMPALSPTMEEGTLAKWLVAEGDTVKSGDVIAEIETDKATMEFEAVDEGVIGKIFVTAGTEAVKVNAPIAILLEDGESADHIAAVSSSLADTSEPTSKPMAQSPSPSAAPNAPSLQKPEGDRIFATPLARRIASDADLDLKGIVGSGPRGRIVKSDVEAALEGGATLPKASEQSAAPVSSAKTLAPAPVDASAVMKMYDGRVYEEVPLNGMRKTIAARLTEAKQTIPHFYLRRDIHLDAMLKFRKELNAGLDARGVKLSVNDFIIKACALALQQVPGANAVWAGDRVLKMQASDVAVAVAIDGGLFTPVLQNAESKTLSKLSSEMKDLAGRARDRKLAPHEYQGGSFAVSNLGMFGIDNFDAVINPPHGAILAVGQGVPKPVVQSDGTLGVATVMSVTLSVDHRVIDGALGAQLLDAIKTNLEHPLGMLA